MLNYLAALEGPVDDNGFIVAHILGGGGVWTWGGRGVSGVAGSENSRLSEEGMPFAVRVGSSRGM